MIAEALLLLFSGIWIICLIRSITSKPEHTSTECFREWIAQHDLTSSELWEYDTGGSSWENAHGERGFAIVCGESVIDFWTFIMNSPSQRSFTVS